MAASNPLVMVLLVSNKNWRAYPYVYVTRSTKGDLFCTFDLLVDLRQQHAELGLHKAQGVAYAASDVTIEDTVDRFGADNLVPLWVEEEGVPALEELIGELRGR